MTLPDRGAADSGGTPGDADAVDLETLDGVTRTPRLVYLELALAGGNLTARELADRTGYTASHIRSAARDLADRGIVERRPDPSRPQRHEYRLAGDDADPDHDALG